MSVTSKQRTLQLATDDLVEARSGYRQTDVGVIPEDWALRPLSDDISLLSGHHVLAEYCNVRGEGTPYLTGPADFPEGRIRLTKFTTRPTTLCRQSDILVTVKGSGSGTLVQADAAYCISRQLMAIRTTSWDSEFLFYSLLHNASGIRAASTGLIPGLSRSDLFDQVIPLPKDLPEQRAIAEALSDVDELLRALDALIAKKRAIKQAAMQQLLTGRTRLPDFSGSWETKRLGDIATIAIGRTPSRSNAAFWGPGHVWLSIADLDGKVIGESKEQITDLAAASMTPVPKGALLMSFKLSIGRVCFAGCDLFTNEAICSFTDVRANTEYLYYALSRTDFSLYGKQAVKGYTLNSESLRVVEVDLPSQAEQEAIATVLSDMAAEIVALERRRDKTRQVKEGMMQQLLTGRIRLVEPTKLSEASA